MSKPPRTGDRASWRGISCTLEYVAEDAALISYRLPGEPLKHAFVSFSELHLSP